jgi:3-isopropylmalate/(R)-2-methylmalate dehydratase small subunit
MQKFTRLQGIAALMPESSIDTDAIIPARFMRSPSTDFGKALFANFRYGQDGAERPDFVLNQDPFRDSAILVAGANFGCGSSREAAVWALMRFGIRCVIAESYGEIFYENCFKNGLLPVTLPAEDCSRLARVLAESAGCQLLVDLEQCLIVLPGDAAVAFSLSPSRRHALLEGLDEIQLTLKCVDDIGRYEVGDSSTRPWVHSVGRGRVVKEAS